VSETPNIKHLKALNWPHLCIKESMKKETYLKYYSLYRANKQASFLLYKEDTELTHTEKELLSARVLMRSKQWDTALLKLEGLKTEIPFLKAERYFLMASNYLIKSEYEESVKFGNLAVRYYEIDQEKEGLFKSFYNLSVAFNRIGMESLCEFYLIQAGKNSEKASQRFIMDRARVCALSSRCEFDTAVRMLDMMLSEVDQEIKFEAEVFKIVAADIYFRAEEFEKAKEVITSVMNAKSTRERGRALFYFHLLSFIETGKKLPSKPESVAALPEFSLQWDIILNIMEGETELVSGLWEKLCGDFPKFYGKDFECLDQSESKAIFNTALNKLLLAEPAARVDLSKVKGKKSRLLLECLVQTKTPVRKEVLIEKIWGMEYSPSLDARFYKLIERSKGLIPLSIKNEHNAYYLAS
jgi:tetratricopeptide (TPR) repeat protein